MAGDEFHIRTLRGAGYDLNWNGRREFLMAVWATKLGIDDVNRMAVAEARFHPAWENDSGQTEESVFMQEAELELVGMTPRSTPHVWGYWGIESRAHLKGDAGREATFNPSEKYRAQYEATYGSDELAQSKLLTTVDVALFLEFGTVKMEPRPWIYPSWDLVKHRLPGVVQRRFEDFTTRGSVRVSGRFTAVTAIRIRVDGAMMAGGELEQRLAMMGV